MIWKISLFVIFITTYSFGAEPINVLFWDEQQPEQKQAYDGGYLGQHIVKWLKTDKKLNITLQSSGDKDNGVATKLLNNTDVLVYWSHKNKSPFSEEKAREIAELVKAGKMNFLVLHSAHWSLPFMVCMEEKAKQDALERLPEADRSNAVIQFKGMRVWKKRPTHAREKTVDRYSFKDGKIEVMIERPNCVFQRCCTPMQASQIRVLDTQHPIVKGIPKTFTIPETEMYDEPYGIPEPDVLILDESWKGGEHFRSGCLWKLGKGEIFYFRPGHETYNVFKQENCLKIVQNAIHYLAAQKKK